MWGARKKSGWVVSWTISELSASTPTSRRLQSRTRGNGAERQNKGGTFHGEMDRCRETKAGLRHAVVCPNVTGRTKKRMSQSKRARAGSLALVTSHKWRELVYSGRLVCRCHGIFSLVLRLFCFASFFVSMLSLKPRPFVQSSFDVQAFR